VNLAERHGKEGAITHAYGDYVKDLDSPDIRSVSWDLQLNNSSTEAQSGTANTTFMPRRKE
jgi:hypothetical protein